MDLVISFLACDLHLVRRRRHLCKIKVLNGANLASPCINTSGIWRPAINTIDAFAMRLEHVAHFNAPAPD
jgi:hypothetical protein